jgi:alpha-L-fucosidase
VTTQKQNNIYVHVLDWNAPLLALSPLPGKISGAHSLIDNAKIEFTQNADGVILKLPPAHDDETDRVIVLTVTGKS